MRKYWWVGVLLLSIISCNEALVYSEYEPLNNGVWKEGDTLQFQLKDLDTLGQHHIFLNVRNDERYEFSNLFLILELEAPSGTTTVDTLEYEMAMPNGAWLGSGMGSVKESKLWYKENIAFDEFGVYTINVQHAMRKNGEVSGLKDLLGITDIGVQIEKAQ